MSSSRRAYFRLGVDADHDDALRYELTSLRRKGEGRWYWLSAEFVVDQVKQSGEVKLYYVRRPRQARSKAVILQSNWNGMQYFTFVGENAPTAPAVNACIALSEGQAAG